MKLKHLWMEQIHVEKERGDKVVIPVVNVRGPRGEEVVNGRAPRSMYMERAQGCFQESKGVNGMTPWGL